jgi:Fe2+ or Zn2+ uptake regulation protein
MVECGILTRIQLFDRKKHYGLCNSKKDHHHHIVCIKCGKVDTITECAITDIKKIKGYRIVSHYMQVNGICENCSQ